MKTIVLAPRPSLESRGRPSRVTVIERLPVAIDPVLIGLSLILLLAAAGVVARFALRLL
jgi:ABC-type sulfate transport system permease subunit